jgi:hypothetical protein
VLEAGEWPGIRDVVVPGEMEALILRDMISKDSVWCRIMNGKRIWSADGSDIGAALKGCSDWCDISVEGALSLMTREKGRTRLTPLSRNVGGKRGDITSTGERVIAHQTNCETRTDEIQGAGIFRAFPWANDYGSVRTPGTVSWFDVGGKYIANLNAQKKSGVGPGMGRLERRGESGSGAAWANWQFG